jgi:hypothetical protein
MASPWISGPSRPGSRAYAGVLISAFGLALSVTLVFLGMRSVMDVGGACADGGPYVSAQPCPDGVAAAMILGMFGLFGFGAIGMWYGGQISGAWAALPFLGWPALFGSLGYNFLAYGLTPPPGSDEGVIWGWVVPGVIFELMAFVPLLVALRWRHEFSSGSSVVRLGLPDLSAGGSATGTASKGSTWRPVGTDDIVSRLERLAALHRAGSLTDTEFEEAKKTLLENARSVG